MKIELKEYEAPKLLDLDAFFVKGEDTGNIGDETGGYASYDNLTASRDEEDHETFELD